MSQSRIAWIDGARAIAVALVVLFHFLLWPHAQIAEESSGLSETWAYIATMTGRLRMPLLMAVSGYLAASAIHAGWVRVRLRAATNAWLYVVWLAIYLMIFRTLGLMVDDPPRWQNIRSFRNFFEQLVAPTTVLWFVFAMALFPLLIWVARRLGVPAWALFGFAFAAFAASTSLAMPLALNRLAGTFMWFVIGYLAKNHLSKITRLGAPTGILLLLTFWIGSYAFSRVFSTGLGLGLAALASMIAFAALGPTVTRPPWLAKFAMFVGGRTLEIYVLHVPLMVVIYMLVRNNSQVRDFTQTPMGDGIFVIGSVVAILAVSLALGTVLRLVPGVMSLPTPLRTRLLRTPRQTTSEFASR